MERAILIIGFITLIYLVFTIIEFLVGFRLLKNLSKQTTLAKNQLPKISVIFSALNEEVELRQAMTSMLQLDYPNLEIIAINDRSIDATPQIMNELAKKHPQLKVFHIEELPDGWFGKNHALEFGSKQASGEWLLFTDADVFMKPDTLSKAISFCVENDLDHLTIHEHHVRKTLGLKILLLAHYLTYSMMFRPWRIRYAWSKKSLGHGAFNLVKTKTYHHCGGHRKIALECLDDMKLGALIKENGYKQDTVDGRDYIEREWYASLRDMIEGWKKNTFAYFEYKIVPLFFSSVFAVAFFIWPLFAVCIYGGMIRWLNIANILMTLFISVYVAKHFRLQKRYAIFYPVAIGILLYTIWNSVVAFYSNKGVIWRGTLYTLDELKAKKLPQD